MLRIQDLRPADELICTMRLGLALYVHRHANGVAVRMVPGKPRVALNGDVTRFTALVMRNDPESASIVVTLQAMNSHQRATDGQGQFEATIPYHAFKRVERLSKYNYPGRANPMVRPTKSGFHRPYRTREEVRLTS